MKVHDHAAAGWYSEAKYRRGRSTSRREARATSWFKKQVRRSARRAGKADLRLRQEG